jgi:hypothetical protein
MAIAGEVELDLSRPLGPDTRVSFPGYGADDLRGAA